MGSYLVGCEKEGKKNKKVVKVKNWQGFLGDIGQERRKFYIVWAMKVLTIRVIKSLRKLVRVSAGVWYARKNLKRGNEGANVI